MRCAFTVLDRKKIIALFFVAVFALACGRKRPVDFQAGEFSCDYCRMRIVDMSFKTEAVTKKGKVFHFDSIECLWRWHERNSDLAATLWVTDFHHPSHWIELSKAYLLQSPNLPSPMGANLSAFASDEAFQKALDEFGGEQIEPKDIR